MYKKFIVDQERDKMLKVNIIELSNLFWVVFIDFVKKWGGIMWFCVDF